MQLKTNFYVTYKGLKHKKFLAMGCVGSGSVLWITKLPMFSYEVSQIT